MFIRARSTGAARKKALTSAWALDLVQATHERRYDVAIIVSQDSDFSPAVSLAKQIAASQNRTLTFASAFPVGPGSPSRRGIHGTNWVRIDQAMYACLDPRDYRPARR